MTPLKTRLKSGKQNKTIIAARSHDTGLTHIFGDLTALKREITKLRRSRNSRQETDLINSVAFWDWIHRQPFTLKPQYIWSNPLYRLTYGGFVPTSIVGSISDGGRFNIGGAQVCPEFPNLRKVGCLYLASTLQCCYAEAADPKGRPDEYELILKKRLHLWDLKKAIEVLNNPGLDDLVKASPMEALWSFQKVPLIPQLLAHFLREKGGDGIVFSSTKDKSALNFALFFKTDTESAASFMIKKLNQ